MLEGTLAYMSPEQTGRMNRAMDYRTDFYSLGVTFYQMLDGAAAVRGRRSAGAGPRHIARRPTVATRPSTPRSRIVVSNIVMKLMAKNAEDRYQSAWACGADLERCLESWRTTGKIEPFELGRHDVSDRFQIPQKLYGRDEALASCSTPSNAPSRGHSEMMLVAGYSGIGKSALVHEIHKPITRQRGYFISGKFDQLKRNIPYSALVMRSPISCGSS